MKVLVEGVRIEVCRDGWGGFVQPKSRRPSLPIDHSRGLAPASSAFNMESLMAFWPDPTSHRGISIRWRNHWIGQQKYVLFVVVHSNGVANGKTFGMMFVTALSAVGAGVELVKQSHLHESMFSRPLLQLF